MQKFLPLNYSGVTIFELSTGRRVYPGEFYNASDEVQAPPATEEVVEAEAPAEEVSEQESPSEGKGGKKNKAKEDR